MLETPKARLTKVDKSGYNVNYSENSLDVTMGNQQERSLA